MIEIIFIQSIEKKTSSFFFHCFDSCCVMYKKGRGLINSAINHLPFEAHIPGYQYCGPGTNLEKRLARGDSGINPLDTACKTHDIAYSQYKDGKERTEADKLLTSEAWKRFKSKDASIGERATALLVSGMMKAKVGLSKLGKGMRKCRGAKQKSLKKSRKTKKAVKKSKKINKCTFKSMVSQTKKKMKTIRPKTADEIVNTALSAAHHIKGNKNITQPRIIPIPKSGGVLPLVPIFAGLSALGSLAGGASSIINAIKSTNNGKHALNVNKHSRGDMAGVVVGKSKRGEGLYLRPYKKGFGLYLRPYYPYHSKN
jgi:hypothetical protein